MKSYTFVTVRKLNSQTSLSNPFSLTRRKELIDNTLSSVNKITKLSLPNNVRMRVNHRIS